jgi:hypothetical protein
MLVMAVKEENYKDLDYNKIDKMNFDKYELVLDLD